MTNLMSSFFNPSQTVILIVVAVIGVLLIVLNIVLAYVFHKRGERKLYDLMLQHQRELLMQQLDQMRTGELVPDEEAFNREFFNRTPPEAAQAAASVPIETEPVEAVETVEELPAEEAEIIEEPEEAEEPEELALAEAAEDDENTEVVEEVIINGQVVRFNRSFTARLIQADEAVKARYSEIKNYILSYGGVKNRISWKRESFRLGRNTFACFTVRGKTLCLSLATDPKRFEETKYKVIDLSVRSPKSKQPCMYRITSERRVKYAKELIAMLMAELGAEINESYIAENFAPAYQSTQKLVEEGLIKLVGDGVPVFEEIAAAEPAAAAEEQPDVILNEVEEQPEAIPEEVNNSAEEIEEPEETEELEEPEEAAVAEMAEEDENAEAVEETVINGIVIRYNRSYTARITQSNDLLKQRYSELKNYILSYNGVRNRISWKRETFRLGRNIFACFVVRGKTLCLCLATDPKRFEETKYKVIDLSVRSPKSKQPCMYRITSDRRVKYAKELIAMLMSEYGVALPEELSAENYVLPYRTTEELIKTGLIRLVGDKVAAFEGENPSVLEEVTEEEPPVAEVPEEAAEEEPPVAEVLEEAAEEEQPVVEIPERDFEILEEVAVTEVDVLSDEEAEQIVEDKVVKKQKPVARKKGIVNIDSLSKHFEAGAHVNLQSLREKKLIANDVNYLKVLAKGTINKPLTVEADDFSLQAVKMLALTGGRVIRTKYN